MFYVLYSLVGTLCNDYRNKVKGGNQFLRIHLDLGARKSYTKTAWQTIQKLAHIFDVGSTLMASQETLFCKRAHKPTFGAFRSSLRLGTLVSFRFCWRKCNFVFIYDWDVFVFLAWRQLGLSCHMCSILLLEQRTWGVGAGRLHAWERGCFARKWTFIDGDNRLPQLHSFVDEISWWVGWRSG